jgi:hypothetical protein
MRKQKTTQRKWQPVTALVAVAMVVVVETGPQLKEMIFKISPTF